MDYAEIRDLLSKMTIEEKCRALEMFEMTKGDEIIKPLVMGYIPRFDIYGIRAGDNATGSHDYFRMSDEEREAAQDSLATCYPPMSTLAASWNVVTAEEVGAAIGRDARNHGIQCIHRPGVNIKRSPLCGRNYEYFSEDPVLTGILAAAYINGLQSENVAACLKHYCANNQEFERMTMNSVVSERALREIYLRGFEIAIAESNPWTLMTAYNKINGEWANSNKHLMVDILRNEWKYKGLVMSDGIAVQTNKIEAHKNHMDVECSGFHEHLGEIIDAYYAGNINLDIIDESVSRVLELYHKVKDNAKMEVDHEKQHEIAIRAAEDGMILLKNEGQILPIQDNGLIAVIGSIAEHGSYVGAGSGHTNARKLDRATDKIKTMCRNGSMVYAPGYPNSGVHGIAEMDAYDANLIEEAVKMAESADKVLLFIGNTYGIEGEGYDRATIDLPKGQQELIRRVSQVNSQIVMVVTAGSIVNLAEFHQYANAIIMNYMGGEGSGSAIANVLFGLAEPGGRLPESWPMDIRHTPAYHNFGSYPSPQHDVVYGEGVYVGYRWYESRNLPVLYPFGYGLSYTTFLVSKLVLSADSMTLQDKVEVSVTVKNTGHRRGSQVIQIYVKDLESSIDRPEKELKAFAKVVLNPGEETVITRTLDRKAFEFFSPDTKQWVVEDGLFEIQIGVSALEIVARAVIKVDSMEQAVRYNRFTPIQWMMEDAYLDEVLADFPEEIKKGFKIPKGGMWGLTVMIPIYRFAAFGMGLLPYGISMDGVDTIIRRFNELHSKDEDK